MSNRQQTVIFIIDDNPSNIKVLTHVLALSGYKTLIAMDGLSGIQKIIKAKPDLILLDIMMPNIDGFETCKRLKALEKTHDIPIIFMTALASTADKVKGLSLGAVDYITKPFQQEEVVARIETHLKICRLAHALEEQNQKLKLEIKQRQKAEEELKILSRATEQSPASIVITNVDGDIEYVNPKFEELTGYTLAEAKGNNPRILKTGHTMTREYETMWNRIASGENWYGEFQNKKKNGDLYWEYASISGIKNSQGEITHYVAVKEDITQRKLTEQALLNLNQDLEDRVEQRTAALQQSERQLQQTNEQLILSNLDLARETKLKDEFLANMSHELRTPLNAILGLSEALQDGALGELGDRQKKALHTIETSGQHLLQLINDILDIAKIASGKLELYIEETNVHSLCSDSISFVRQLAFKKNIQLELQISDRFNNIQNSTIPIDQLRMRQALINLLSNAVKFTPEDGSIKLDVTIEEAAQNQVANVVFTVRDTGIGIAPEHIGKLFQPFVQIDSALNRQYAGTGLGLSLVRKITELHGGNVSVKSELDRGSCFTIKLPCQKLSINKLSINPLSNPVSNIALSNQSDIAAVNIAGLSPQSMRSPSRNSPLKILIAKDRATNVGSIWDYLESQCYKLSLATNGQEAIEAAIADPPDLILMDIQTSEVDGLTAIKNIRANSALATVVIVVLTGCEIVGDRQKCLEAGANEYLTKPIKLRDLANTIQNCLQVSSSQTC